MTGSREDSNPFAAPDAAHAPDGPEIVGFEAPRTSVIVGLYSVVALQTLRLPFHFFFRDGFADPEQMLDELLPVVAFVALALLGWLTFLVTAFLWGRWVLRAARNLRALSPDARFDFTPASHIWWYFVPILGMWKPYEGMREIEQVTSMGLDVDDIGDATKSRVPPWWTLWLLQGVVALVGTLSRHWVLTMLTLALRSGAALAAVRMIRSINRRQERAAGRMLSAQIAER